MVTAWTTLHGFKGLGLFHAWFHSRLPLLPSLSFCPAHGRVPALQSREDRKQARRGRQLVWETPSLLALRFRKGRLSKSFPTTPHPLLGGGWSCFDRALLHRIWGPAKAAAGAPRLPSPEAIMAIDGLRCCCLSAENLGVFSVV